MAIGDPVVTGSCGAFGAECQTDVVCSDGCVQFRRGNVVQVLETRSQGGKRDVRAVTDIREEGIVKMGIVRDTENIAEERGKVVGLTKIIGEGAIKVEERVAGGGFIPSKAVEGIPVLGGVDGEMCIETCNCLAPVPAFSGSQKVADVSL